MSAVTHAAAALALCALALPSLAAEGQPGAHFLENWDLNADGQVSLEELQERRGDVFNAFDADENGALDAEEYALFDAARATDMKDNAHESGKGGGGKGMRRVAQGLTLPFNDTDADGLVSRAEFLGQSKHWLVMIDRDGDSAVTAADFGGH